MQIRKPAVAALSRLLAHSSSLSSIMTHRGIAMILSPAKTLDLTPPSERTFAHSDVDMDAIEKLSNQYALPLCDGDKTNMVVEAMKKRSESELKTLLKLSPALAKSSYEVSETDTIVVSTWFVPTETETPLFF